MAHVLLAKCGDNFFSGEDSTHVQNSSIMNYLTHHSPHAGIILPKNHMGRDSYTQIFTLSFLEKEKGSDQVGRSQEKFPIWFSDSNPVISGAIKNYWKEIVLQEVTMNIAKSCS